MKEKQKTPPRFQIKMHGFYSAYSVNGVQSLPEPVKTGNAKAWKIFGCVGIDFNHKGFDSDGDEIFDQVVPLNFAACEWIKENYGVA